MINQTWNDSNLFATGVIRSREASLLTDDGVRQILTADERLSPAEILRGTVFGDYLDRHGSTDPAELIPHIRDDIFLFLRRHVTPPGAVRFLLLPYDYHNLKVLLKGKLLDVPAEEFLLSMGNIPPGEMTETFAAEEYGSLPRQMAGAVNEAAGAWYAHKDPRFLDTVPDRYMLLHLLDEAIVLASTWLEGYCRLYIDCSNLRILSRSSGIDRKILEDYIMVPEGFIEVEELLDESVESICLRHGYINIAAAFTVKEKAFAVESACTRRLREYLNEAQYAIGGIEPSMAFALTVEEDLRIIGTLMKARASGMDEKVMESRLPGIP